MQNINRNLCNLWLVLVIAFITSFNYGGCGGGGGGSSGSSIPISLSNAVTNPATNVTANSAILSGTVNPKGANTSVCFDYGTTISYGNTTGYQNIGSDTIPVTVTATITGLSPNTTYNFRVRALAGTGGGTGIVSNGTNLTFTTAAPPPTCVTNPATNITSTSARLNGSVNPNGFDTTAYFNYGTTTSYDSSTTSQTIGSGLIPSGITADINGLSSSALYNFRVVGVNSNGTTYGNNRTFTTGAPIGSAPTCTTDGADNVTYNSARLNGTVNPNGVATTASFNYGTTTSYGSSTNSQSVGSGISSVAVLANLSGLSGNTLYNFRVVGTSASGTTYGGNLTFTTAPPPPTCVTQPATNVTYNSTTLNGTVNPNGLLTDAYFQWGATISYGTNTTSQAIGNTTSVVITADIIGLLASTVYNFRVVGTNSSGTTNGNNLTFTTSAPPPPTCTTNAADNVATTSARLNGTVNPNGSATTGSFQYGTTTSYGSSTTSQSIGSGTTDIAASATVSSLTAVTLYNFRCVATNSSGTTNGSNLTFTTTALPPPTCTTSAADNITSTSARLNGTVNPNGLDTNAYFNYGLTTSYTVTTTAQAIGSGTSSVAVSATVTGLTANTLYNFRVAGTNSYGTTNGDNLTFTTASAPTPICITNDATNISSTFATLNGTVNPNGLATNAYFNYGLTTSYTVTTTAQAISSGTSSVTISATIIGLTPNTLYNFRVVATNSAGTGYGDNLTFTTATAPTTAVDDYVWVASAGANNSFVTRVTKSTLVTTTITAGTTPRGIAVDETYVWVANWASNNVTRISKSDLSTTTIAVGDSPRGVAVDNTYCWVANNNNNNITRITKSTLATTNIAVGTGPYGVAVDGTYCWVANQNSATVTRITKATSATTNIAVGTYPFGVAVDETYCWVTNGGSNNVTRITKSTSATTNISVGNGAPNNLAVDETYVWGGANYSPESIFVIRKSDSALFGIPVGATPGGVAVDETYCWLTHYNVNYITRITKATYATTNITVRANTLSVGDMTGYAYDNYANQ